MERAARKLVRSTSHPRSTGMLHASGDNKQALTATAHQVALLPSQLSSADPVLWSFQVSERIRQRQRHCCGDQKNV